MPGASTTADGGSPRRAASSISQIANTNNDAHLRSVAESESELPTSGPSDRYLNIHPARRGSSQRGKLHRRYSFPNIHHDRKQGETVQRSRGYLTSAWNKSGRLVGRVTRSVGTRIDKTIILVPEMARRRIKTFVQFAKWSVCAGTLGYVAWHLVVHMERLDRPEAFQYRSYPYWMHTHDPYNTLDVPRPLVPEWGPPPMPTIKKAFAKASARWHVDRYRYNFKNNGTVTAKEMAEYAYDILDHAKSSFEHYWKNPYCRTLKVGPLLPNVTAEMTRLGLPFIDPTCTPCTWDDATKKFVKAVLLGPQAIRDPSRVYCPCSLQKMLETLYYNLRHLPPAGLRRYYPYERQYNTGFLRKLRTAEVPDAWFGSGLKQILLGTVWRLVNRSVSFGYVRGEEDLEELMRAGWIVQQDLTRFKPRCDKFKYY